LYFLFFSPIVLVIDYYYPSYYPLYLVESINQSIQWDEMMATDSEKRLADQSIIIHHHHPPSSSTIIIIIIIIIIIHHL